MRTYKLQQFEGPLDLLLQMIEREELDLTKVSLASLADQFVAYIEQHPQEIRGEELADFLVVATQLLLLKSRLLIPDVQVEDDVHPDSLATQLKLYRRFIEAAQRLQARIEQRPFMYARASSPLQWQKRFSPPPGITADHLKQAMHDVINRLKPIVILPESVIEKTITLHEKMTHIQQMMKQKDGVSFRRLLTDARSKTEKIVCFLALLELVKQEEVVAMQSGTFDDIQIKRYLPEQNV